MIKALAFTGLIFTCFTSRGFSQTHVHQKKASPALVANPPVQKKSPELSPVFTIRRDTAIYHPVRFYIASVEDSSGFHDSLGNFMRSQIAPVEKYTLKGGTVAEFSDYLSSTVKKDTIFYPVVFRIKKLVIEEKPRDRYVVSGKLNYEYECEVTVDSRKIKLISYTGGGSFEQFYLRKRQYDSIINNSLSGLWKSVDENMERLMNSDPAFCQGVKVDVLQRIKSETEDTLFYDGNTDLTWEDYKGHIKEPNAYFTYMNLYFSARFNYENRHIKVAVQMGACMNRPLSWVDEPAMKSQILLHEQYRFKLLNNYALKLKKALESGTFSCDQYTREIQDLNQQMETKASEEIQAYDYETKHGMRKKEQLLWQKRIDQESEETEK